MVKNVGGRHVGFGDGVYRSRDGGQSWEHLGLENSEHIGMIVVDPRDPETVFVASQGPLWSGGGDRGLFKSTDGGQNWKNVLSDNEWTGVTEVSYGSAQTPMSCTQPPTSVCAPWAPWSTAAPARVSTSPPTAVKTWRKISQGLPADNVGKIALAVSPANPDVVYASIERAQRHVEFYRSKDRGESWQKQSEYDSNSTGPHYYVELWASPHDVDIVWEADNNIRLHRRTAAKNHRQLSHGRQARGSSRAGFRSGQSQIHPGRHRWRPVRELGTKAIPGASSTNMPITQFLQDCRRLR